jgi:hypothetical protein
MFFPVRVAPLSSLSSIISEEASSIEAMVRSILSVSTFNGHAVPNVEIHVASVRDMTDAQLAAELSRVARASSASDL